MIDNPTHPFPNAVPVSPRVNLTSLGRFVLMVLAGAMLTLAFTSSASAGVNGKYEFVSAGGFVSVAGHKTKIRRNDTTALLIGDSGTTVIRQGKIRFGGGNPAALITDELDDIVTNLKVNVSVPRAIKLRKVGKTYVGTGNKPVIVTLTAKIDGRPIRGMIRFDYKPKVIDGKLTMTVSVSGSLAGFPIRGNIRVISER